MYKINDKPKNWFFTNKNRVDNPQDQSRLIKNKERRNK